MEVTRPRVLTRRTCLAILALLTAAGVAALADSARAAAPAAPCSHELDLSPVRGLWTVPIRIGSSPPLAFVIDSGSELTALTDLELAEVLDLHTRHAGWGTGMGGTRMPVLIAPDVGLRTAGGELFRTGLAIHELGPRNAEATDLPVHGLLGSALFEHFVVDIDPDRRTVLLHDPKGYSYPGRGHVIPLEIDRRRPFVRARVTTAEGRSVKVRLMVDTGSENHLALIRSSHRHIKVPEGHLPTTALGVGGAADARSGPVSRLEIGSLSLGRTPATFFHPHSVAATRTFRRLNGILGNGILGQYRTIIDYHHSRLILEPR
jgi:hypothetical protein